MGWLHIYTPDDEGTSFLTLKELISSLTDRDDFLDALSLGVQKKIFPDVKNVIFEPPCTIVFWEDGTKTIVKDTEPNSNWATIYQDNDNLEWIQWKQRGLMQAVFKKLMKSNYLDVIDYWVNKQ